MNKLFLIVSLLILLCLGASAQTTQKGIDTQTQKIKEESNSDKTRHNDATRSFDWGKGKTKVRGTLANPYKLNSRRDVLMGTITDVLRENKIMVDEAASRVKDGIIVTQPFTFAKGAVIAPNELNRYAIMPSTYYETSWTGGKYILTIEVQSIDGIQNNVSVIAKIEGRSGNGLGSEWTTLQSSGLAEDEFLVKLVESVTGKSFAEPEDPDQ